MSITLTERRSDEQKAEFAGIWGWGDGVGGLKA